LTCKGIAVLMESADRCPVRRTFHSEIDAATTEKYPADEKDA
jgi:hypothetical protein